jgi:hypothetical protein
LEGKIFGRERKGVAGARGSVEKEMHFCSE